MDNSEIQQEEENNFYDTSNTSIVQLYNPLEISLRATFCVGKKLFFYRVKQRIQKPPPPKITFSIMKQFEYEEEIAKILILEEAKDYFALIGSKSKNISLYSFEDNSVLMTYKHPKKITNAFVYDENSSVIYLIIADKFGEITIKKIPKPITKENFESKGKIMTGHCNIIDYLQVSPSFLYMLSSDSFGKIKICTLPNVFKLLGEVVYSDKSILYINFIGTEDHAFFVITKTGEIDIWQINDLKKINNYKMNIEEGEDLIGCCLSKNKKGIMIITNKKLISYDFCEIPLELTEPKEIQLTNPILKEKRNEIYSLKFNEEEGYHYYRTSFDENGRSSGTKLIV
ncbi:MAG: TMEM199/VMA12 family vacuolar ATPase assembly factor [archaeon]|nr:TMEM199/VMA12 family vacuolar ATPase assembly factor [archaeon]